MRLNIRKIIIFIIFISTIVGFYFIYVDVKKSTLNNVYALDELLVKQAKFKLNMFFKMYENDLKFLTSFNEIINYTGNYKLLMRNYYLNHKNELKAITRINKRGVIIYTFPYVKKVIGKDVSYQEHNKYILKYHRPILSDIFKTVQGYNAIALVFPVFKNRKYNGSVSLLINFDKMSKKIFNSINFDKSGFVFVLGKNGNIFFWTGKSFINTNIYDYIKGFKSFKIIIDKMLKKDIGNGSFYYYDRNRRIVKYYSFFYTSRFKNSVRKINIVTSAADVFRVINNIVIKILIVSFIVLLITIYMLRIIFNNEKELLRIRFKLDAQKDINKMQNYIRSIIDSMPSGVIGLNKEKEVVLWNKEITKFTGINFEKVENAKLCDILESYKFLEESIDNVCMYRKPIFINRIKQYINKTYYFNYTIFPLLENNEVTNIIIIVRDITPIVKNEQKMLQIQKIEMIGNMSAGIAHDMNNILGGMVASIDLLRMTLEQKKDIKQDTEISEYIKILENSTTRAIGIVKQLLSLSKKDNLVMQSIDLNESIKEVVKFCRAGFSKNIQINYKEFYEPAVIEGDKIQIEQALLNILINSSHAVTIMRPKGDKQGGEINIKIKKIKSDIYFQQTHPEGFNVHEYYLISISDTGVGMDDITKAQIFDPFFSTKPKDKGSGLGLNMVLNIITRHKGFVSVYSEVNKGTTFNIYIPCSKNNDNIIKFDTRRGFIKGEGMIFVVDDEKMLLGVIEKILTKSGYKVLTASSGEEGLTVFSDNADKIDIVILDMSLPGMTGIDTFKEMKEIKKEIKVILASGFLPEERIKEALALGINAFIDKPFNASQILEILKKVKKNDNKT